MKKPRGEPRGLLDAGLRLRSADASDVLGLRTLRTFLDLELDLHPLVERLVPLGVDGRVVHENVGAILTRDEPVPLAVVEPLHFSLGHFKTSNPYREPIFVRDAGLPASRGDATQLPDTQ